MVQADQINFKLAKKKWIVNGVGYLNLALWGFFWRSYFFCAQAIVGKCWVWLTEEIQDIQEGPIEERDKANVCPSSYKRIDQPINEEFFQFVYYSLQFLCNLHFSIRGIPS